MNWDFLISDRDSLSVSTDTRNLPAGCVFFALRGETFNGNRFAADALRSGAAWAIVDDPEAVTCDQTILVPDTLLALQDLARTWRRHLALPILAITGTNGKTTTKELTAAVLSTSRHIHYTQGNLNNSIGVPLTLLQLTRRHELAIVEMGASHPGDIRELVEMAEPDFGLITNVGRAHLQGFGSFEGVMRTKAELYDYLLTHHGHIFINASNPHLQDMLHHSPSRHLAISPLVCTPYSVPPMPSGTHLVGDYNAENIAAALAVGEYFGVDRAQGLAAIRAYIPTNNRSQAMQTEHNDLVIDAYNANPTSMQAAIQAFVHAHTSNDAPRAYILGGMRELGDYTQLEHQNIVNLLLEHREDHVYLVGDEYLTTTAPYPTFHDAQALIAHLQQQPLSGYRILVKGSRSNQLEQILPYL